MDPRKDAKGISPGVFVMSGLAVLLGCYSTMLAMSVYQAVEHRHPEIRCLDNQKDVASVYDETADNFDSEVGMSENLMGLLPIRKDLSNKCKGHVLEVSCGTGRNIGYYDIGHGSSIDSLTFNDLSKQMVDVCKKKWQTHYPVSENKKVKPGLTVRFSTGSALDPMPLAPGGKKYDTIIQTMGICSTPSPHQLIRNMTQHLDMDNPDSRILLLEHGRAKYDWTNNIIDGSAQKHAELHGCWFNRDIGEIVHSVAAETGLEVVSEKRKHLGTTWIYELKPSGKKPVAAAAAPAAPTEQTSTSSWGSWLGWK
ncbi:hypothetical protein Q7P37_003359 [Cladosporium fusiforme]